MSGQADVNLGAGSEEDIDVVCDPCQTDGHRVKASGHCVDCNQNFCGSCLKFHTKIPALIDHITKTDSILSEIQKMQAQATTVSLEKDALKDKCPRHPAELIKLFCHSHASLGCSVCIPIDHRDCKDISYIPDISKSDGAEEKLRKVQTDLHILVAKLSSTKSRANWVKQTVNDSYTKAVCDIGNLKKEITKRLDQLEKELIDTASHLRDQQTHAIENTLSKCDAIIRKTEEMISNLDDKKSKQQNNQLFVSIHNSVDRLQSFAEEANILSGKIESERLLFKPDDKLTDVSNKLSSLGMVSLVPKSLGSKAEYLYDINFNPRTHVCETGGMVSLPDGRLAVTDFANGLVNIVDTNICTIVASVELDFQPVDLTFVEMEKLAVTLYKKRSIQMLKVFPVLSECQTIRVPGFYWGIQYIPDKLILVCRNPEMALHVVNMSGTLLQKIQSDYAGNAIFMKPSRIAISPDLGTLYVTDIGHKAALLLLTIDGRLITKAIHDTMKYPIGVTTDDSGFVYVCSKKDRCVNKLSPDGQLSSVVQCMKSGYPSHVVYMAGKIYLSSGASCIKVYSM